MELLDWTRLIIKAQPHLFYWHKILFSKIAIFKHALTKNFIKIPSILFPNFSVGIIEPLEAEFLCFRWIHFTPYWLISFQSSNKRCSKYSRIKNGPSGRQTLLVNNGPLSDGKQTCEKVKW